eukprot:12423080-Karenia_brevis.AAC.1
MSPDDDNDDDEDDDNDDDESCACGRQASITKRAASWLERKYAAVWLHARHRSKKPPCACLGTYRLLAGCQVYIQIPHRAHLEIRDVHLEAHPARVWECAGFWLSARRPSESRAARSWKYAGYWLDASHPSKNPPCAHLGMYKFLARRQASTQEARCARLGKCRFLAGCTDLWLDARHPIDNRAACDGDDA